MGQALWFASRATGLVALLLLTLSLVLGIVGAGRVASVRWPRFARAAVHRNISLMTVLFVGVHGSTSIIDPYAGIGWVDACPWQNHTSTGPMIVASDTSGADVTGYPLVSSG